MRNERRGAPGRSIVRWAVALLLVSGLDAQSAAPPRRYELTANTVRDTKTSLTWQRATPTGPSTWAGAQTYCSGLALEGSGWRLPKVVELQTLLDIRRTVPAIDTVAFPETPSDLFWTATPLATTSSQAWVVDFAYGQSLRTDVTNALRVRCVR